MHTVLIVYCSKIGHSKVDALSIGPDTGADSMPHRGMADLRASHLANIEAQPVPGVILHILLLSVLRCSVSK